MLCAVRLLARSFFPHVSARLPRLPAFCLPFSRGSFSTLQAARPRVGVLVPSCSFCRVAVPPIPTLTPSRSYATFAPRRHFTEAQLAEMKPQARVHALASMTFEGDDLAAGGQPTGNDVLSSITPPTPEEMEEMLTDEQKLKFREFETMQMEFSWVTTDLHRAVRENDLEKVRTMELEAIDFHAFDELGDTPMHIAVACGHVDMIKLLLELGSEFEIDKDELGRSPLAVAVEKQNVEAVRILIDYGLDVEEVDMDSASMLYYAAKGSLEIVNMLIDAGAPAQLLDLFGRNILFPAAENHTPDGYAVTKRLLECVPGPDLMQEDATSMGHRAFAHALRFASVGPARAMLEYASSQPNGTELKDKMLNEYQHDHALAYSSLGLALSRGNKELVDLLMEFGARTDVGQPVELLMCASVGGNPDLVRWVVRDLGIAVNLRNSFGRNAGFYAGNHMPENNSEKCIKIIDTLVELGLDINQQDAQGNTILHLAALRENIPLFEHLLNKLDADASLANVRGLTPVDILESVGELSKEAQRRRQMEVSQKAEEQGYDMTVGMSPKEAMDNSSILKNWRFWKRTASS
eukprot:gnl/Spiro4/23161_TR11453_c0_g1_i1.p1 gnl/Spiro4/23161_TR11453_c0_g1~~gnl/Spiro4/23161_TR11453_c0_g1_i1.p1  ORF type:complete len:578 (+),score=181.60 gnl/Spiro4/23161_TR11453_c0_g1_i1:84-1817(+)